MNRVISKCLLALAVLQGVIPADHCILKLAGICCCEVHAIVKSETPSCCHPDSAADSSDHSAHFPLNDDHKKPCCAYTPANGLTADVQTVTSIDTHVDCVPTAFVTKSDDMAAFAIRLSVAPQCHDSPQPFDTPLYVRVRSFLL